MSKVNIPSNILIPFFTILCLCTFPSSSYSTPITYYFSGTFNLGVQGNYLEEDYVGKMLLDSEPIINDNPSFDPDNYYDSLYARWLITSFSIMSNNFQFLGSGVFHVAGNSFGLYDIAEANLSGYYVMPSYLCSGQMNTAGIYPHYFYDENGIAADINLSSYLEVPYMISGQWDFHADDFGFSIGDFRGGLGEGTMTRMDTAPIPEPATFFLLGSGLAGLAWFGRKRKKE